MPTMKIALRLSVCGLMCLIASLFLPSLKLTILGTPAIFMGWQATIWAIGLGFDALVHIGSLSTHESLKFLILGIAGILNIVFVAVPAILLWKRSHRSTLLWLGSALFIGVFLGLVAPFVIENMNPTTLVGYFVWIFGCVLQLGAIALVLIKQA